jgi:hypothetical protein
VCDTKRGFPTVPEIKREHASLRITLLVFRLRLPGVLLDGRGVSHRNYWMHSHVGATRHLEKVHRLITRQHARSKIPYEMGKDFSAVPFPDISDLSGDERPA